MLLKKSLLLSLRSGLTLAPAPDVPAKSEKDRSKVVPGEHAIWVCAFNKKSKLLITFYITHILMNFDHKVTKSLVPSFKK